MKQTSFQIKLHSRPFQPETFVPLSETIEGAVGIEEYKPFLHKIAASFGFDEMQSRELAEQVLVQANRSYSIPSQHDRLKVWLSKSIVHKCIFKISSSIFSQTPAATNSCFSKDNFLHTAKAPEIPLSFQTVYSLVRLIGLNEMEVAEILNITPLQVRERLGKAQKMIKSH